jgi:hypothetical protein
MSDDAAMVTAFLADRHVACPGCGYDLHGATEGRCPECGEAVVLEVESPRVSRLHAVLLIVVAAYLAVIGTVHAIGRWTFVYDNFVKTQVFVTRNAGGGASSITIRGNPSPAQLQRAMAGGPTSGGWAALPLVVWMPPILATGIAVVAWAGLAWVMIKRPFDRRRLPAVTAVAAGMLAAVALTRLVIAANNVVSRL